MTKPVMLLSVSFGREGIVTLYKAWIHLVSEYDFILYSKSALCHLNHLDQLQAHGENMFELIFPGP